jgi:UDP-N-acetylmuramoyl-L-alanyl-D-glutamate--2,6-diaminopimelate ligase
VTRDGDALAVFVDYAHSDDALRTVLTTLRESMTGAAGAGGGGKGGRRALTCVFGCGGDRDKTKRARMGRVASELADQVYITSDNPRTEDPDAIIGEIVAGIEPARRAAMVVEPDREKAIRRAIRGAAPGGVVLIAGKGHEDYQIVRDPARPGQTIMRHFDDREVARSALAARGILPRASLPILVVDRDDAAVSLSAAIDATEALFDADEEITPPSPQPSTHQRTPPPPSPRS